jgi:hypothetical protein
LNFDVYSTPFEYEQCIGGKRGKAGDCSRPCGGKGEPVVVAAAAAFIPERGGKVG